MLNPGAPVFDWFNGSPSQLAMLRELNKHGEIIRLSGSGNEARLVFRHDRVKKQLLIAAVIEAFQNINADEQIFSDPFFSDVIGAALADKSTSVTVVNRVKLLSPLALFYALHTFREPMSEAHEAILESIQQWLADESSHTRAHQTLRSWALHVLAETQSSHVVGIVNHFREKSWGGCFALLRNGDLGGGIRICYSIEPGTGSPWRDNYIEHAKARFGSTLVREIDALLRRDELSDIERVGALRLVGHFGEVKLAEAIWECWQSDKARAARLDEYLWAIAQCAGERAEELLSPVCDVWASLSDEPANEHSRSPRNAVAVGSLTWAFRRTLPQESLEYFIKRARDDKSLRPNILYMLHGADRPNAVEFVVRELARGAQQIEGTNRLWPFISMVTDHWQQIQRVGGKIMSPQSRQRLRKLWEDPSLEKHLRIQSLRLWAATIQPDDLAFLQQIDLGEMLGDDVLRARLTRKDKSAIPFLIEKIKNDKNGYWWQSARHIWSEELTQELDAELSRRDAAVEKRWDAHYRSDWITGELLTRLPPLTAETLLLKHWKHVRFRHDFVQAAIYTATPRLLNLVSQTMAECPQKGDLLEFVHWCFGIRISGRPGVTRIEQVEALVPYLDCLSDLVIYDLWLLCNERGWIVLRKTHLDPRLSGNWRERSGLNDELVMSELDKKLTYDRSPWMDQWVDDHLRNGLDMEGICRALRKWLRARRTTKALEIASSIIVHAGRRPDSEILLDGNDGSQLAGEIIADTRFAIFRRTLT